MRSPSFRVHTAASASRALDHSVESEPAACPVKKRGQRVRPQRLSGLRFALSSCPSSSWRLKGVVTQHRGADGEGLAEDVRAVAFVREACAFAHPLAEHLDPILREWVARLGEKAVILARTAPFGQSLVVESMAIQVVELITQVVAARGDGPLLGPPFLDGDDPMLAVNIGEAQTAPLGHADAAVVKQSENGAFGARSLPIWRCAV